MIVGKPLTIQEILNEMRTLKRTVLCLCEKRDLNRILRYMKAIQVKDVCVQSSKGSSDVMLMQIIKDNELTDTIDAKITSYTYKVLAVERIKEMSKTATEEEMIVFYRDILHWKWEDIARATNYSLSQCHRKYKQLKNK